MKIGAIVQARMSSTRLPGKVLKELPYGSGITVLEQVIRRLKRSRKIGEFIIATTFGKEDDAIVQIAERIKTKYFRGDKEDVLSRHYFAARENALDAVVRVTSDCPCVDAEIADLTIEKHLRSKADYTSNNLERTYPHGLDVEIFNFNILEEAHKMAKTSYDREHVTPYIYRNPNRYRLERVKAPPELSAPEIRITLDTEEDYALLRLVFDSLYPEDEYFTAYDIVNFFKKMPKEN